MRGRLLTRLVVGIALLAVMAGAGCYVTVVGASITSSRDFDFRDLPDGTNSV